MRAVIAVLILAGLAADAQAGPILGRLRDRVQARRGCGGCQQAAPVAFPAAPPAAAFVAAVTYPAAPQYAAPAGYTCGPNGCQPAVTVRRWGR